MSSRSEYSGCLTKTIQSEHLKGTFSLAYIERHYRFVPTYSSYRTRQHWIRMVLLEPNETWEMIQTCTKCSLKSMRFLAILRELCQKESWGTQSALCVSSRHLKTPHLSAFVVVTSQRRMARIRAPDSMQAHFSSFCISGELTFCIHPVCIQIW
jgi:hypothetical protein